MIAVIFEVWPQDKHRHEYFDLAAALRPLLDSVDGFISVERFESLSNPGKILSLSFFRDEVAVEQWRKLQPHRAAQAAGRERIFKDYRLRIAGVMRDYAMSANRDAAPADSRHIHGGGVRSAQNGWPVTKLVPSIGSQAF